MDPSYQPRYSPRLLTFPQKPGVHRFVMPGFRVRIKESLPRLHHYLGGNEGHQGTAQPFQERKQTPSPSVQPTGRRPRPHRRGPRAVSETRKNGVSGDQAFFAAVGSVCISRWVMRRTSSIVVIPRIALIIPSSNSVCIPCLRANLRTFCVDSPLNAISRTCGVIVISS